MSDIERLECAKCNSTLPGTSASPGATHQPCPQCGSTEQVLRLEFFDEAATPRDRLEGKVKDNGFPSKKSIRQEFIYGFDKRRSRGDYVYKEREINRDNDSYRELIKEEKTCEIIHGVEEKLSEHFGHGSDKFPKKSAGRDQKS